MILLASTLDVCPASVHDRPDSLAAGSADEAHGLLLLVAVARNTRTAYELFRPTISGGAILSTCSMAIARQIVRSPEGAKRATASDTLQSQHIRCQV